MLLYPIVDCRLSTRNGGVTNVGLLPARATENASAVAQVQFSLFDFVSHLRALAQTARNGI